MDKADAVRELITEGRTVRMSKAALKRVRKACQTLGLDHDETARVEQLLQYRDRAGRLDSRFE